MKGGRRGLRNREEEENHGVKDVAILRVLEVNMAIHGVGAYFGGDHDVSSEFIRRKIIGIGWSATDAPDLHAYLKSLKVGDIVYIKSKPIKGDFSIKAIGIINSSAILNDVALSNDTVVSIAREVKWVSREKFVPKLGKEKSNVRSNSLFEEYNPLVQKQIITKIIKP